MGIETTQVTTFTCSVSDCDSQRIVGGDLKDAKNHVITEGWVLEEMMLGKEWDLCPFHVNEIKDWLGL